MYVLKALRALYRTPGVGKYLSKNAPVQFWLSSYFHISGDPHQSLFGSRSKKKVAHSPLVWCTARIQTAAFMLIQINRINNRTRAHFNQAKPTKCEQALKWHKQTP